MVRDRRGSLSVEFALIAPLLILLYFGCSEISIALSVARKVQGTTGAVNDLVTRSKSVSSADLNKIFDLTKVAIAPFDATPFKIKTSSIHIDADGKARVDWSCGDTGSGKSKNGDDATLPKAMADLRSTYILKTESRYDYKPFSGYVFKNSFDLGAVSYADPRYSDSVTSNGC